MTTKENAEKQARELLAQCNGEGYYVGEQERGREKLVKIILDASRVEELEQWKAIEQGFLISLASRLVDAGITNENMVVGVSELIAERDSFKAKAEALDWLAEHLAYAMMGSDEKHSTMWTLPNNGKGWKNEELLSAINAAKK